YTFAPGSFIGPNKFLVLAANRAAFAAAYGATFPVFDTFSSPLSLDAQTLALLRPVGAGSNQIVAQIRYEDTAPWPAQASGSGSSLQLIDPTQENWRVGNWAASSAPRSFTPSAANSVQTNLPAFPELWVNELQPENLAGITNSTGQRAPWLEI